MASNTQKSLPQTLPVFPLDGVLLLPGGSLPLNIFEPRYLAMIDDALRSDRLIGMIQPDTEKSPNANGVALQKTGCAGKITAFQDLEEGRYLITLTGVCRFTVDEEIDTARGYRRVQPAWDDFTQLDLRQHNPDIDIDRDKLTGLLESYFEENGLCCEWELLAMTPDEHLITALAMICPFSPAEKQALLEARCCEKRGQLFINLLEMAVQNTPHEIGTSKH